MSFIVSSILRFSMFRLKKEKRKKSVVDMYSPFPHVFGFWVKERKLRKKNIGKWRIFKFLRFVQVVEYLLFSVM